MRSTPLARRLGLADAVFLGLGSMIGAGVFAAFAPAARAAGSGLLIALVVATVVAYCNATSSAQLAAIHPQSGGTYVYGRERLGEFWGYLAGWGFVTGKTASCAAMTLTVVAYAAPGLGQPWRSALAVAGVAALTAVNYFGVHRSALATRVIVSCTLLVLTAAGVAMATGPSAGGPLVAWPGGAGVLQAAGLLFFAFAGYARITTLGEEVIRPERTIPRATAVALAVVVVVYLLVAVAALTSVGPTALGEATAPLHAVTEAGSLSALAFVVQIGAAAASLGALLSLVLGVSRTTLAMARDRHLPSALATIHPRYGIPHRAEVAVGAVVVILVATIDLRSAIGFSSFGVLLYYLIANISAFTQPVEHRRFPRWLQVLGAAGCVLLVATLPWQAVVAGLGVFAVGTGYRATRLRFSRS
jgi:basic amino acid/polyamine antiporter, APA family